MSLMRRFSFSRARTADADTGAHVAVVDVAGPEMHSSPQ